MTAAPPAGAFAARPASWQIFAPSRAVRDRPVSRELFGRRLVAFRSGGKIAVIDGRCWHLGADLGGGELVDGCVACPFHGWRFDATGRCISIPAQREIPSAARQATYAAVERGGLIWAFPAERPAFDLPFFEGVPPGGLRFAPPFAFELNCPWWMVGTNGFDVQHFAGAHDRRLVGDLLVTTPHPFARRVQATFAVVGRSWRDRLTRLGAGAFVTMTATVWGGTVALVEARFHSGDRADARRVTYGLTTIRPVASVDGSLRTLVGVRVGARCSPTAEGVGFHSFFRGFSGVQARVKSSFVRAFLEPDARLLDGARYDPARLVGADRVMIEYLRWLAPVSHGLPELKDSPCTDPSC